MIDNLSVREKNVVNKIKELEKQVNNKKLPQYKRNQARAKLYDIETKWHSRSNMVWNSNNGTYEW